MAQPVAAVEAGQPAGDVVDHGGEDLSRHRAAAETLGQRNDADRQRCPRHDVVGEPRRTAAAEIDQRDFGRAAADIEQHDALRVALDQ